MRLKYTESEREREREIEREREREKRTPGRCECKDNMGWNENSNLKLDTTDRSWLKSFACQKSCWEEKRIKYRLG